MGTPTRILGPLIGGADAVLAAALGPGTPGLRTGGGGVPVQVVAQGQAEDVGLAQFSAGGVFGQPVFQGRAAAGANDFQFVHVAHLCHTILACQTRNHVDGRFHL